MVAPWALNKSRLSSSTYKKFYTPIYSCLSGITPLTSRGDKPVDSYPRTSIGNVGLLSSPDESGVELLQAMEEDDFARTHRSQRRYKEKRLL